MGLYDYTIYSVIERNGVIHRDRTALIYGDELITYTQLLDRVDQAIAALPEHFRVVLWLRDGENLSYQEIADSMSLSVSNVGFILHTAMQTIRAELGNDRRAR